jgi:hypothetical protein
VSRDEQQVDGNQVPACTENPIQRIEHKHHNHGLAGRGIPFKKLLIELTVPVQDTRKPVAQIHAAQGRTISPSIRASYTTPCLKDIGEEIQGYEYHHQVD